MRHTNRVVALGKAHIKTCSIIWRKICLFHG